MAGRLRIDKLTAGFHKHVYLNEYSYTGCGYSYESSANWSEASASLDGGSLTISVSDGSTAEGLTAVIVPKNPPANWKEGLLQTGLYEQQKLDYLLEGEDGKYGRKRHKMGK